MLVVKRKGKFILASLVQETTKNTKNINSLKRPKKLLLASRTLSN